jgi:hypothetical protein
MSKGKMYTPIIEAIFQAKYKKGAREVDFAREDIVRFAKKFKIAIPKNLGDLVYSFRYRKDMPAVIQSAAGEGETWIIQSAGRSKYCFVLEKHQSLLPNENLVVTKVPDSTPGVIAKYALSDEQALLAKLRYNRLVDIFTGVTCYSLQNHLRTSVSGIGQIETDEIYIGVDKKGAHYVIPVQAKGGRDRLNTQQIRQDIALCVEKFPSLVPRSLGAQFMPDGVIAMFEFEKTEDGVRIVSEKHYKLVPPDEVTEDDLRQYRDRLSD